MKTIQNLLEKWKQKTPPEYDVRGVLPYIIKKHTGADIKPEHISLTRAVVFIKASSITKTEIFIKKEKILEDLHTVLGEKAPKDIR